MLQPLQETEKAHGGPSGGADRRSSRAVPLAGADLILTSTCEWQERRRSPREMVAKTSPGRSAEVKGKTLR